jgi:tartrate dehydrogenase/decarboxylase/D-malate dehydrogenase
VPEGVRVLDRLAQQSAGRFCFEYEYFPWGCQYYLETGRMMDADGLDRLRAFDAIYFGAVGFPGVPDHVSLWGLRLAICQGFDQYANVRPVRLLPGVPSPLKDATAETMDWVVVRENTEGEYAGLEHQVVPGVVESIKVTTARACTRIARFAFALAAREHRRKVTAVHKANIMKRADGLFLECCRAVAAEYPAITYQELIVDNVCMQLVMNPYQFDVLVTQNFYGDVISDLCAGLVGGRGVVPGANLGDDIAVYEAIDGDAATRTEPKLASPMPLLVSALFMLRQIGLGNQADRIGEATTTVLERNTHVTRELGGMATTGEMADAIIAAFD